jgi:glycosyltransferase involved in cell wall biosynthesis
VNASEQECDSRGRRVRVLRIIARMNIGGPAYDVALLAGRLGPSYETLLLTGRIADSEGSFESLAEEHGATLRCVPGLRPEIAPLDDLRALMNLVRIIRTFAPDIVHTHTAKAGALGRLAALLAPGPRPLLVHTYHGHVLTGYFGAIRNAFFRSIERLLGRFTDALIGVSTATVRELLALKIAPARKFHVIPIGLELEPLLEADRADGSSFRVEVGAEDDTVLAMSVGRLAPIKRVDLLIDALGLAATEEPRLLLAVVGDGELRSQLEARVHRLGLQQRVVFLGFRHDLRALNAGCDIAVLSSDNEGTPVALIEASAAARPIVGGVADIVTSESGTLVPAGDARAFADALVTLARDGAARERMGVAAREHVRERFTTARLLRDVDVLYRSLLDSATAKR